MMMRRRFNTTTNGRHLCHPRCSFKQHFDHRSFGANVRCVRYGKPLRNPALLVFHRVAECLTDDEPAIEEIMW